MSVTSFVVLFGLGLLLGWIFGACWAFDYVRRRRWW